MSVRRRYEGCYSLAVGFVELDHDHVKGVQASRRCGVSCKEIGIGIHAVIALSRQVYIMREESSVYYKGLKFKMQESMNRE